MGGCFRVALVSGRRAAVRDQASARANGEPGVGRLVRGHRRNAGTKSGYWLPILALSLSLGLPALSAGAQTPHCDELKGYQKILATELLVSEHPYACCDDTIENCLEKKPTCSLAFRLAETICLRVARGEPKDAIVTALQQRRQTMLEVDKRANIDLTGLAVAGDASAPITLVEYACPRCPYCAMITPQTYDAVVNGPLKGKVKLYFKTFPIRGHGYAQESGLAFLAAQKLGHFWDFVLHAYQRFDLFSPDNQLEWAEAVGMDRKAFQQAMSDPATRLSLIQIKREGIVNEVNATPTFFLNGRKLDGAFSHEELIDILEEEIDRLDGVQYRKAATSGAKPAPATGTPGTAHSDTPRTLTRAEARQLIADHAGEPDFVVLDIRTAREFAQAHLPHAVNPVDFRSPNSERDLDELDKNKTYVVYCRTGSVSSRASRLLAAKGFRTVYDLEGGIEGWTAAGFEVVTE